MTKADIDRQLAENSGASLKDVKGLVNTLSEIITDALVKGDKVAIPTLGTFKVREAKARTARNPKTGDTVQVPAKRKVVFTAAKELKKRMG